MGVYEQGFYPQNKGSEGPSRSVAAAAEDQSASPDRVDLRAENDRLSDGLACTRENLRTLFERLLDDYAGDREAQRRSQAARLGWQRRRGETE